jgi:dihydroorotate dehydrogenase
MVYKRIIKPFLFLLPPEKSHHFVFSTLDFATKVPLAHPLMKNFFTYAPSNLQKTISGITFPNPVGLAAGFDKDAAHLKSLSPLGFGFIEVGTVTPLPQPGNEKPRLFRLPKDEALINRMGFNNHGVDVMVERLKRFNQFRSEKKIAIIIGGNIGKNKNTPNEKAADDYVYCFEKLFQHVDYFTVNVSSPNTPGLQQLQNKDSLFELLHSLQQINLAAESPKPIFLKISPDLSNAQLDDVVTIVKQLQVSGIVACNTTTSRDHLKTKIDPNDVYTLGGLSGKPLLPRTLEVIAYLKRKSDQSFSLIASGGIFTSQDAKEAMQAGADLVQVYSGFIYEGPAIVKQICKSL